MKKLQSKIEELRKILDELWYRYQCYYRTEVTGGRRYGYKFQTRSLRYYLKYSEEERKRKQEEGLAAARYFAEHWAEIQSQNDEEERLQEQKVKEFMEQCRKKMFRN